MKLPSGRYILTVICGIVFALTTIMEIKIDPAAHTIIGMVFISYFQRKRQGE